MAKLPIQRIQWNIWISCNEDDFDLEIEVPVWFEDIVRSAENSYSDIVSALDALVKSQQVPGHGSIAGGKWRYQMNSNKLAHEFECFVIKYQDDLYVWRNQDKTGKFELTGHRNVALQRADRPTQEELEIIAEYLGVWFSDLSVVKRTIFESLDRVAIPDEIEFQAFNPSEREQLARMGINSESSRAAIEEALDKIRKSSGESDG